MMPRQFHLSGSGSARLRILLISCWLIAPISSSWGQSLARARERTTLRAAPDAASADRGTVAAGDTIEVLQRKPTLGFLQVRTADTVTGWLSERSVEFLVDSVGAQGLPVASKDPQSEWPHRYMTVRVFFATDRQPTGKSQPMEFFGTARGSLTLGQAEVTIPKNRRPGTVSSPSWLRLEFRQDPSKHVVLTKLTKFSDTQMADSLRAAIAKSRDRSALVFVHGFNVTFGDAVRRTAQIAYDLGFDGAAISYSWPSQGTLFDYTADLTSSEASAPDLEKFLQFVIAQTGAKRIELLAHSMGSRALMLALDRLSKSSSGPLIDQVVFAAADVDQQVFKDELERVRTIARRVTLYASSADEAMAVSRGINKFPRAGDGRPNLFVWSGLDTIDASAIPTDLIGHGYFAENKEVLDDLFQLLINDQGPDRRRLNRETLSGLPYWVLP